MTSCEVQYPVYTDNIVSTVHGTEWLAEPSGCLQTDKINQYCYEYVFLLVWDLKGAQDQEWTAEEHTVWVKYTEHKSMWNDDDSQLQNLKKPLLFSWTLKRLFIIYQSNIYFYVGVCPSE